MEDELYEVIRGLVDSFYEIAPEIWSLSQLEADDADILIVAHGLSPCC